MLSEFELFLILYGKIIELIKLNSEKVQTCHNILFPIYFGSELHSYGRSMKELVMPIVKMYVLLLLTTL